MRNDRQMNNLKVHDGILFPLQDSGTAELFGKQKSRSRTFVRKRFFKIWRADYRRQLCSQTRVTGMIILWGGRDGLWILLRRNSIANAASSL